MKKLIVGFVYSLTAVLLFIQVGFTHCQVPCGIYDDEMRFEMFNEDISTIEKATNEILKLSEKTDKNYNQIVRWVNTKEDHADKIIKLASEYFLAQRIALPENLVQKEKVYYQKISLLHQIIVYAMKTKQSTDISNIEKLKILVSDFQKLYFEK
ncbi:MAG: superoxide dismutase [Ni] [Endomicrobiaceae bacterium]|nr:superoxide dismutase [Ni] [Endomicrobiaceae bacterium]